VADLHDRPNEHDSLHRTDGVVSNHRQFQLVTDELIENDLENNPDSGGGGGKDANVDLSLDVQPASCGYHGAEGNAPLTGSTGEEDLCPSLCDEITPNVQTLLEKKYDLCDTITMVSTDLDLRTDVNTNTHKRGDDVNSFTLQLFTSSSAVSEGAPVLSGRAPVIDGDNCEVTRTPPVSSPPPSLLTPVVPAPPPQPPPLPHQYLTSPCSVSLKHVQSSAPASSNNVGRVGVVTSLQNSLVDGSTERSHCMTNSHSAGGDTSEEGATTHSTAGMSLFVIIYSLFRNER